MRVYILSCAWNCIRRTLDTSRLVRYFKTNGCVVVNRPQDASHIIITTCSFIKNKEEECMWFINKFRKFNAQMIVIGCLPAIAPHRLQDLSGVKAISTKELDTIDNLFPEFLIKFADIPEGELKDSLPHVPWTKRSYLRFEIVKNSLLDKCSGNKRSNAGRMFVSTAFLRVGSGCTQRCSYCNIFTAVGALKSRSLDELLKCYEIMLKKGHRRIIFIGDNVGAYGIDIGSSFEELLSRLSSIDKSTDVRWEIQDLNPVWAVRFREEIVKRIAEKKIVKITCPVQSGSPRILKLMNRYDKIEDVENTLSDFKKACSDLYLKTHYIVGFPSESDEDFMASLGFIKRVGFDEARFYPYYDGYGTLSSKMPDKIHESTVLKRMRKGARALAGSKIKTNYNLLMLSRLYLKLRGRFQNYT